MNPYTTKTVENITEGLEQTMKKIKSKADESNDADNAPDQFLRFFGCFAYFGVGAILGTIIFIPFEYLGMEISEGLRWFIVLLWLPIIMLIIFIVKNKFVKIIVRRIIATYPDCVKDANWLAKALAKKNVFWLYKMSKAQ